METKKIAIIDDDRELAGEIKDYLELEFEDLECFIFSTIDEFASYEEKYDLIIMDYNLQDEVNGLELAQTILDKKIYEGKFLFVTGEGGLILRGKIHLTIPDYDYVEKGADMYKKIVKIVEEYLEL